MSIYCGRQQRQNQAVLQVWLKKSIPHLANDFRTTATLVHVFYRRIESDERKSEAIARLILSEIKKGNSMFEMVFTQGWNKRSASFEGFVADSSPDFLRPSVENLRIIVLAIYRFNWAPSYHAKHIKHTYLLQVSSFRIESEDPLLLYVKNRNTKQVLSTSFTVLWINLQIVLT